MARVYAGGSAGVGCEVRRQYPAMDASMLPECKKAEWIRVEERPERIRVFTGGGEQVRVRVLLARLGPASPAGLQQPEAGNVLQQPDGSTDTAFIGKVQSARARRDDRRWKFSAEERPSS